MRIKKIIFGLMLLLLVEFLSACCLNCLETSYFHYTNCSVVINNLDHSGEVPVITQSNKISKDAFGLRVVIQRNENTCKAKTNPSILFQSAYATSCKCPPEIEFLALDSITSLKVITNKDFDSEHLASSDVSEYFGVLHKSEYHTIIEYINQIKTTLLDFGNITLEFDLMLLIPPTVGTEQKFTIEVELSDGRIFAAQTELLELNE